MRMLMADNQSGAGAVALAVRWREVTKPHDKAYCIHGVLQAYGAQLKAPDYSARPEEVLEAFFFDLLAWQPTLLALLADAGE